jgi:hypothetical protein
MGAMGMGFYTSLTAEETVPHTTIEYRKEYTIFCHKMAHGP